jgi:hypothetical protein
MILKLEISVFLDQFPQWRKAGHRNSSISTNVQREKMLSRFRSTAELNSHDERSQGIFGRSQLLFRRDRLHRNHQRRRSSGLDRGRLERCAGRKRRYGRERKRRGCGRSERRWTFAASPAHRS